MPWLRAGDNIATHPMVMRVGTLVRSLSTRVPERDVALNEVFGFVMRCALQSAGHTTDYVIDEGTMVLVGGARVDRLTELAVRAGYLTRKRKAGETVYLLVDNPDFIHLRRKAEIEWDRQQRADASNPQLIVPVRLRDGDVCRYCSQVVNWRDRRGGRGGTYDHRDPGEAATVDTLVVACRSCNSGRRDRPDADHRYQLQPAPAKPFYSELTATLLAEHGHTVTPTADLRPGTQPGNATQRPPTRGGHATAATRTSGHRATTTTAARSADPADRLGVEPGFAGTGRDGPGRADSSTSTTRASPDRRKRSRRGKTTRSTQREA